MVQIKQHSDDTFCRRRMAQLLRERNPDAPLAWVAHTPEMVRYYYYDPTLHDPVLAVLEANNSRAVVQHSHSEPGDGHGFGGQLTLTYWFDSLDGGVVAQMEVPLLYDLWIPAEEAALAHGLDRVHLAISGDPRFLLLDPQATVWCCHLTRAGFLLAEADEGSHTG